ncbi:ATP-binding cassette domain-containing protein [Tessaracoccus palaemonis]|uniref:ABC transporter ATP-binding protein n=1 Tax=Tessaracoccus palaemonis TaxID=2829499 RepID=A0ABX8SJW1_9ACTN|nr:ABC transporter ATP-binding protein [Tessaracoccus palaemonis]QXT63608.1 ABC transporter ATP-binding protein [Tessaracoccus palaemonis]
MLEIEDLTVALPSRGVVLHDVTLTAAAGRITALVGPGGRGTSTLLRLLARTLPGGALRSGRALLDGRDLLAATPADVRARCLLVDPQRDDPHTVDAALADLGASPADYDLVDRAQSPVAALPPDLRARVAVARLEHGPRLPLVLVDQPSAALDGAWRARLGWALRARADDGAHVMWAEHQLDQVWQFADDVAEPREATVPLEDWAPVTVREPTMKTLSRALRIPPSHARTPEQVAALVAGRPAEVRRSGRVPTAAGTVVSPVDLGLAGDLPLEIGDGESVGVVAVAGRPEPVARALTARLRGTRVPSVLPGTLTPGELCRQWDRAHGTSTAAAVGPTIRLRSPLSSHSSGEQAGLRMLLAGPLERAVWLPQPQLGLDQAGQIAAQRSLAAGSAGIRIITTRDVEFLVRACSRVLVVDGETVVAFGTPRAVLRLLPDPPLAARALPAASPLRLGDVLDSLAEVR